MKHSPAQMLDLDELRRRIAGLEGTRREAGARTIGSGCDALDELLPEKGFRPGTLIEWLSAGAGGRGGNVGPFGGAAGPFGDATGLRGGRGVGRVG